MPLHGLGASAGGWWIVTDRIDASAFIRADALRGRLDFEHFSQADADALGPNPHARSARIVLAMLQVAIYAEGAFVVVVGT
jgi:hypothetical protein